MPVVALRGFIARWFENSTSFENNLIIDIVDLARSSDAHYVQILLRHELYSVSFAYGSV